jgi:hypothetical protein
MHVDPTLTAALIAAVTAIGIAVYQRRAGTRRQVEIEAQWQRQAQELHDRIEVMHEKQHTDDKAEISHLRNLLEGRRGETE